MLPLVTFIWDASSRIVALNGSANPTRPLWPFCGPFASAGNPDYPPKRGDDRHTTDQLPLLQAQAASGVLLNGWTGRAFSPGKPIGTDQTEESVMVPWR